MSDSVSAREIIERLVKQAGIKKKLAAEILHVIPQIIEEGLLRDGEVRVKGLGTFRLKWVLSRTGRNPKTGERVEIPAHNRLVFLPEQSFKEYINRDYRLLSYKIIPGSGQEPSDERPISQPELEPEPGPQPEPDPVPDPKPEPEPEPEPEPLPSPEPSPESDLPAPRRRIHWIIPAAISVIVILSLIFYFRNFYPVGGRQSAVGSQQSADSGQQSAVSGQQSAVGGQQPKIDNRQSTIDNRQSVPPSQHIISAEGKHLFQLAREIYGNPYLWVLIYRENQNKIPDPDMLISGIELIIPALEGTPEKLTRKDSLAVSDGYRLLYEYFGAKEDTRTDDFFKAMERYKPD